MNGRIAFEQPLWLVVALVAIPLAWIAWRRFGAMSRARRLSAIALRAVLATLLAALLAGATWVGRTERAAVIVVADLSGSVRAFADAPREDFPRDPGAVARLERLLANLARERGPDDRVGLVVFGERALASVLPTRGDITQAPIELDVGEGTDIENALRYAAALAPPDASTRLLLVSDGVETSGDALAAARAAIADASLGAGVRLDVAPIRYEVAGEVTVESLDVPPRLPAESRLIARVTLRATQPTVGTLRLLRDGQPLPRAATASDDSADRSGLAVALEPGGNTVLFPVDLPPGRVHRLEAVFEPALAAASANAPAQLVGDTLAENNRASSFTLTPGAGAILLVEGPDAEGGRLVEALRATGVRVDVVPPSALPADLLGLETYDLVLLRDVPADAFAMGADARLAAYVRDLGGGLVMIGGRESFGAGGWKGSDLEPVLPVSLDLPERLVAPEAAIAFVLDSSGSMNWSVLGSSRTKQQIVNDATAIAIRSMDKRDLVSVIAFNREPRVVVPLAPNDDPDRAIARVLSITSNGGTNIGPALREARDQLAASNAKIKHVILLSDGQSMAPEILPELAARMAREGIRVSAIAVGEEADLPTMERIANLGGGVFYRVLNPDRLPRVFIKAVRIVRTPLIREGLFDPVVLRPGDVLAAPLPAAPPPLSGLVLTTERREPGVRTIATTPGGEPLLAAWRVGLGQAVAFTSDAGVWASDWIESGLFDRFWTHIARLVARAGPSSPSDLRVTTSDGRARLRLEMTTPDGAPRDELTVDAVLYGPDGEPTEITLSPTAPGVYEGDAPAATPGVHVAVVKPREDDTPLAPVLGGVAVERSREFNRLESDEALLARLAEAAGGRVLDLNTLDASTLFDRADLPPRVAATPLWPALLVWAVVFALMDIASRRVAWDRWLSPQFGADWRAAAAESVADRGRAAAGALAGLRKGREERIVEPADDRPTLGAEDAAAAARAQLDRIRAERADAQRRAQAEPAPGPERPAPVVESEARDDDNAGASGLLAAKRRARERYLREEDNA